MSDTVPGWEEQRRRGDGMTVKPHLGGWVVIPPDDRIALTECPCCKSTLTSSNAAAHVADYVYPEAK